MIRNYFKIAWRTLLKNKTYSTINIVGLGVGLASALVIFSFIRFHFSFDNYHPNKERIYRFVTTQHREDISYRTAVPNPFGKVYRDEFDFSEYVARVFDREDQFTIRENERYNEEFVFAEEDIFNIFKLPLISGNAQNALSQPNSVVLTQSMAKKFFGEENPINKTIVLPEDISLTVTAVMEDIPLNSELQYEIFISYNTIGQYRENWADETSWGGLYGSMSCYTLLKEGVTPSQVEKAIAPYPERFRPGSNNRHVYTLQALNDIHFNADFGAPISKKALMILGIIALFILLSACINFINLATAQSLKRAKEIGVRKVMGSLKRGLFYQFLLETAIVAFAALLLAGLTSYFLTPIINQWIGTSLSFNQNFDFLTLTLVAILFLFVVLIAGAYPGLVLSKMKPVEAIKNKITQNSIGGFNLRRSLIVVQFIISQVLIIGLVVVLKQMDYATNADLGFQKEGILMLPNWSEDQTSTTVKNKFLELAGVDDVSVCFASPASTQSNWGNTVWFDGKDEPEIFQVQYKGADESYLSTFDISLLAGRNIRKSDTLREFLVNESFVKKLNLASPEDILGRQIAINGGYMKADVVGVVEDFNNFSFREAKTAVAIGSNIELYNEFAVKVNSSNLQNTTAQIEEIWTEAFPDKIYQSYFLDENLEQFYQTEKTMLSLIKVFAFIAIAIGCLGLLGLVSFIVAQKTKEIGIRKVLGSSISEILWIFGKELGLLMITAAVIAVPIGWKLMSGWLEGYAYRIELNYQIFAISIGFLLAIAAITALYHSLKAALVNPVESLKNE